MITPRNTALTLLALIAAPVVQAQLIVDHAMTPQQLVQNVLLGSGVTVSNVTFNGQSGNVTHPQIGYFDGAGSVLQLDSGLVMATGDIDVALGPNNSGSAFAEVEGNFFSDNDLDNVAGDMSMDIACLEFDFVPSGDSISFAYSFASEEYLEWVNSIYNDAFGFFLSGPGIFGPFDNDAVNIAVAPGTLNYVSVNTINNFANAAYYEDNGDGSTAPYSTNPYYIQFDGFTVGLRARAAVQCGQTYHIKMAIGDVGDPNWDSGVFIVGGSFNSSGGLNLAIATSTGGAIATEGCAEAIVTITRGGTNGDRMVAITTNGSASPGGDVSGIPTSVTIPNGALSTSFIVQINADALAEGSEVLTICASGTSACGNALSSCADLIIEDTPALTLQVNDVVSDCSGTTLYLEAMASGGHGTLAYTWSDGSPTSSIAVPDHSATYSVTVTDACGNSATREVHVLAPCSIHVPNVITPNGDGTNDAFVITGIEGVGNHVRIFNRWGQTVFEAVNYTNNWTGGEVSDGTYFYEVSADGSDTPLTGHLTILNNRNR